MIKKSLLTVYMLSFVNLFALDKCNNLENSLTDSETIEAPMEKTLPNDNRNPLPLLNDCCANQFLGVSDLRPLLPANQTSIIDSNSLGNAPHPSLNHIYNNPSALNFNLQDLSLPEFEHSAIQNVEMLKPISDKQVKIHSACEKKPFKSSFAADYLEKKMFKTSIRSIPCFDPDVDTLESSEDIPIVPLPQMLSSSIHQVPLRKTSKHTFDDIQIEVGNKIGSFNGSDFILEGQRLWIKGGTNTIRSKIITLAIYKATIPDYLCTNKQFLRGIEMLNGRLNKMGCRVVLSDNVLSLVPYTINQAHTNFGTDVNRIQIQRAVPGFQFDRIYVINNHHVMINNRLQLCIDGHVYDIIDKKYSPKRMELLAKLISSPNGVDFTDSPQEKRKWRQWLQDKCFSGTDIFVEISGNMLRLDSRN